MTKFLPKIYQMYRIYVGCKSITPSSIVSKLSQGNKHKRGLKCKMIR